MSGNVYLKRASRIASLLITSLLASGCQPRSSALTTRPQPTARPDPAIEALIDTLANPPDFLNDTAQPSAERWEARNQEVTAAVDALRDLGKIAFPALCAHLDDLRTGACFAEVVQFDPKTGRWVYCSVGTACRVLLHGQLVQAPHECYYAKTRKGVDGKYHSNPALYDGPYGSDLCGWLAARSDTSLPELQIESLEWVLAEERKIGFPTQADRDKIEGALLRKLAELKSAARPDAHGEPGPSLQ